MQVAPQVSRFVVGVDGIDDLLGVLRSDGFQTVGPTLRDGVITFADVDCAADLPSGWGDTQSAGRYRARRRGDAALFGFAAPAGTVKQYLFPPVLPLFTAGSAGDPGAADGQPDDLGVCPADERPRRLALIGVRGCDLASIAVLDRVFLRHAFADPHYAARREGLFLVGVNCADPAATCFCSSMGTGPAVRGGADLVLTELDPDDPARHRFLVVAGTAAGRQVGGRLSRRPATAEDIASAEQLAERAVSRVTRSLDPVGLAGQLGQNPEHPHWQDVADRCLTCANCTLVCPTCFCFDVTDEIGLDGTTSRVRRWGSCFERSHSYLHGGSVHRSPNSRYRQWLTHKFSAWWEQFGESGCVGCGRCITWCPVGIDIVDELGILRAAPQLADDSAVGSVEGASDA